MRWVPGIYSCLKNCSYCSYLFVHLFLQETYIEGLLCVSDISKISEAESKYFPLRNRVMIYVDKYKLDY